MSFRKSVVFALVLNAVILCAGVCLGVEDTRLPQSYSWEQHMDVFVSGKLNTDTLSVKVANRDAVVESSGVLTDMGGTIRTTILLDTSSNVPEETRDAIAALLENKIANLGENEELRLITFDDEISIIQDFTNDRYDLSTGLDSTSFDGNTSMIYDAVYKTIPSLSNIDGTPCYYRTILITAGIDAANDGITKEELLIKLQNETYPINVIEVSNEQPEAENKDLASLVRISGGTFGILCQDVETQSLTELMDINDLFWIRINIPIDLLDGSTRQIDISDGTVRIVYDAKLPAYTAESPEDGSISTEHDNKADDGQNSNTHLKFSGENVISVIIIAILAVMLIFALILIILMRRSKKKGSTSKTSESREKRTHEEPEQSGTTEEGTALLAHHGMNGMLILKNERDPNQHWEIPLDRGREITVGRSNSCDVQISDQSVSRLQFIISCESNPVVINKSESNITQINDADVDTGVTLKKGDRIKCGRVELIVEELETGSRNNGNINELTAYVRL